MKIKKKLIILPILTFLLLSPVIVFAVQLIPLPGVITSFNPVIDAIFNIIWPLFAAFAVIMFIIAGGTFLTAQGEPEKLRKAGRFLLWGIVGVVVALLAFSIPFIIKLSLGV